MGHGTVLAGRYRLEEREQTSPDGSVWRAVDETLDRQVGVRILRADHQFAGDVVDAARRAALVDDPRLVRVLDVGHERDAVYVVSEHVTGRPLSEHVAAGLMPAETVRRLVGEAAQALDRAAARGLHHVRLTPASLIVTADGSVKVVGTAVEAAAAGVDPRDPLTAGREDAVGLVAVLYAGLTGRWPGAATSGLAQAPQVGGQPAAPGDLVAGVPHDLDTLCTVTLGPNDQGPRSPRDLANELAPWARGRPLTVGAESVVQPEYPPPVEAQFPPPAQSPYFQGPPSVFPPEVAPAVPELGGPETMSGMPTLLPVDEEPPAIVQSRAALNDLFQRQPVPVPSPGETVHPPSEAPAPVSPYRQNGAAASGAGPTGWAAMTPPFGRPAVRAGDDLRSEVQTEVHHDPPVDPLGLDTSRSASWDAWDAFGHSGYTGQIPQSPAPTPFTLEPAVRNSPRDQSRLVLAVLAGFVTVGVLLAAYSSRSLWNGSSAPTTAASQPTKTGRATTPAKTPSARPSASPPVAGPVLKVVGITTLDPTDGQENPGKAPRAIDGKSATLWRSSTYGTAAFGGLKDGLGLALDLGQAKSVHQVTVNLTGTGGRVELRSGTKPTEVGSIVVGTATLDGGRTVIRPAKPVMTRFVVLWFTRLPHIDGGYRLVVSEIEVR